MSPGTTDHGAYRVHAEAGEWILARIVEDDSDEETESYLLESIRVLSLDTQALHPGRRWRCWRTRGRGVGWSLYPLDDPFIVKSYGTQLEAEGLLPRPEGR